MDKTGDAVLKKSADYWESAAINWAQDLDLPTRLDKKGRVILVEFARPNATDLIEQFRGAVGLQRGAAIYGYLSGAIHGSPYHLAVLGGPVLEVRMHTVGDLMSILPVAIQALMQAHQRFAFYLGSNSVARAKPYADILRLIRECPAKYHSVQIGSL